jgi:hypothetical protein
MYNQQIGNVKPTKKIVKKKVDIELETQIYPRKVQNVDGPFVDSATIF